MGGEGGRGSAENTRRAADADVESRRGRFSSHRPRWRDAIARRRFGKTGFGFGGAGRDLVRSARRGRTEPLCEPPGARCALSDATRRVAVPDMIRERARRVVPRGDLCRSAG